MAFNNISSLWRSYNCRPADRLGMELLLISKLINDAPYVFHFKGYLDGQKIKQVIILDSCETFQKGESYLLYLKGVRIYQTTLEARVERFKNLDEVNF